MSSVLAFKSLRIQIHRAWSILCMKPVKELGAIRLGCAFTLCTRWIDQLLQSVFF